jgi:SprA-related family
MTALHSVPSTHLRSALPTVNHTRTVLQKARDAVDRPVPPAAVVTLSPQATRSAQGDPQVRPPSDPPEPTTQVSWDAPETQATAPSESAEASPSEDAPPMQGQAQGQASIDGLTQAQRDMVTELAQRDREVHAHEAAHQAAGGGLVGAASYTYQEGPDGRSYAIGGEVPIQIPASDNPSEMISIAQRVRAAALAPANPSGQDLAVANAAVQMEAQARHAQTIFVACEEIRR